MIIAQWLTLKLRLKVLERNSRANSEWWRFEIAVVVIKYYLHQSCTG